ncbi:MAG: murein L,D-transpeptidase catalytic domain family protein [Bdellovibrionales bacterium]|nr:murein L,D-transpeptidase catalytic domain family protein [Bdellovibrionales bacterium]NQZ18902.1 murein L,D-transpeptidase catalytic domain family protein [Bdellovibrionales bacterium]
MLKLMKLFLVTFILLTASHAFASWQPQSKELKKAYNKAKKNIVAVHSEALENAFRFYESNKTKEKLRSDYLGIADFTLKSNMKRLAMVNLKDGSVDFFKVSHGKGSDRNHDLVMDSASSLQGSHSTPLGFHKMGDTYYGKHGLSVKMHGLEKQNKSSLKRLIVLHGAKYVSNKHTGRSLGCPAVEDKYTKDIIKKLKGGGLFYHYWVPKK